MSRNGRPPSMADVAEMVGVSHQTVSRVVNGKGRVSPRTRERVQAAIEQLGYRPNSVARALVTARSGIIGVRSRGVGRSRGPARRCARTRGAPDDARSSRYRLRGGSSGVVRGA